MLEDGYEVILWSARGGDVIKKDVVYLGEKGLNIDHEKFVVNNHAKYYTDRYPIQSPKANSALFLDDKAYRAPQYSGYWYILHQELLGYPPKKEFVKNKK